MREMIGTIGLEHGPSGIEKGRHYVISLEPWRSFKRRFFAIVSVTRLGITSNWPKGVHPGFPVTRTSPCQKLEEVQCE